MRYETRRASRLRDAKHAAEREQRLSAHRRATDELRRAIADQADARKTFERAQLALEKAGGRVLSAQRLLGAARRELDDHDELSLIEKDG